MGLDPYADHLNQLKPEIMIVKNGRTGNYDLRLFDAVLDRTWSSELTNQEGEDDLTTKTIMLKATGKLLQAWLETPKPAEEKVIRV